MLTEKLTVDMPAAVDGSLQSISGTAPRRFSLSSSLAAQVLGVLLVWGFMAVLHWSNNGLWYQGDSSTHAANGLFWRDFLAHPTIHPLQFGLGYYARYPIINPAAYPPFFYLVEAAGYSLFGASPYVAKALVLLFSLLGSSYLLLWLRRWISPESGWAGALLLIQPAIIIWSHAVMLNVPAMMMALAALYHWRRWLDDRPSRHIYAAAVWVLAATLTYLAAAFVLGIMLVFLLMLRRQEWLNDKRLWICACSCGLLIAPFAIIWAKWDPGHRLVSMYLADYPYWELRSWFYYFQQLPRLATMIVLLLALIGLVCGLASRRLRTECLLALVWAVLCYMWFSLFSTKELRYILLLAVPIVLLASIGVRALASLLPERMQVQGVAAALALLVMVHLALAPRVRVPEVRGFDSIVSFLRQHAPRQWMLYDGRYSNLFVYEVRLQDSDLSWGVVRSSKLLYATRIHPAFGGTVQSVSSPADVVNAISTQCGCPYVVIERQGEPEVEAQLFLRRALAGGEFQLVKSLRVDAPGVSDVDVYKYTGPVHTPDHFDFRFPLLGNGVSLRLTPLKSGGTQPADAR